MIWRWPATVLGPATGPHVPVLLDLGCRLTLPTTVRIAGLGPKPNPATTAALAELLPEGAQVRAVAEPADGEPLRAHLVLESGKDVLSVLHHTRAPLPVADYGIQDGKAWRYPGIVRHVIDADTVAVELDLGAPVRWTAHIRIRHVNSPEHGTADGDTATAWAQQQLPAGAEVAVTSWRIEKYGRLLADLTLPAGQDYATMLLAAGHALPYEGGPR